MGRGFKPPPPSQIGLTSAKAGVFPLFTVSFGGSKVFFSSIFSPNICITRAETILKALWYEISTLLPVQPLYRGSTIVGSAHPISTKESMNLSLYSGGVSRLSIVDFAFPVQYTTCTGQKQPILSTKR